MYYLYIAFGFLLILMEDIFMEKKTKFDVCIMFKKEAKCEFS